MGITAFCDRGSEHRIADNPIPVRVRALVALVTLCMLVVAVYWRVLGYGFLQWDDDLYVTAHPLVRSGLTPRGVVQAFGSFACSNWHPVTIVSHMLDVSIFGSWAGGHHLTNVLLHAVNALLVLALVRRLTSRWPESLLVAALFAVHPQRVESVAWVSERKDVLCGLFFLVSILAYLRSAVARDRDRGFWYAASVGSGILACLAKPMAVTLPLVLLLLDVWPLGRFTNAGPPRDRGQSGTAPLGFGPGMLLEKLPLVAMAGLTAVLTMLAQDGALASADTVPLTMRLTNAVVAYATYVRRAFLPTGLAAFYPHPASTSPFAAVTGLPEQTSSSLPNAHDLVALLLLVGVAIATAALVRPRNGRAMPWLAFGCSWFIVMLMPVVGLVQVGSQATADRYYYLPGIGLEFGVVVTAGEIVRRAVAGSESLGLAIRAAFAGVAVAIVAVFMILSYRQVLTWRSDESLWRHAAAVVPRNAIAESLLASALAAEGRTAEAIEHHRAALQSDPALLDSLTNLGLLLSDGGRPAEALPLLERAHLLRPDDADTMVNLAICLARLGRTHDARNAFQQALSIEPDNAKHRYNFAMLLESAGDATAALRELDLAIECDPTFAPVHDARRRILAEATAAPSPTAQE